MREYFIRCDIFYTLGALFTRCENGLYTYEIIKNHIVDLHVVCLCRTRPAMVLGINKKSYNLPYKLDYFITIYTNYYILIHFTKVVTIFKSKEVKLSVRRIKVEERK